MKTINYKMANYSHPTVALIASEILNNKKSKEDNFQAIYTFVRDGIQFGFPPKWDFIKASETIDYEIGYCNSKAILMQSLCKIAQIPVKLRVGMILTKIMENVFPSWAFPFMEESSCHMWVEVFLNNKWYPIDSYILDHDYYLGAKSFLEKQNRVYGCGLAYIDHFEDGNWDEGFIQSNAIVKDFGEWEDAAIFYNSKHYKPLTFIQKASFPILRNIANKKIEKIRNSGRLLNKKIPSAPNHEVLAEF